MTPAVYGTLDLAALRHNFRIVREAAPGTKIMAVIKANAYGHGLSRVAKSLDEADAFAVARVNEGVRLRNAGIVQRIVVMEGYVSAQELALQQRYDLEPVIHSMEQLAPLEGIMPDKPIGVWIKLDSGMHRLGFSTNEFKRVYERLQRCQSVRKPIPLMTHLANADHLDDETTVRQISLFNEVTGEYDGERSIANSAGILGWKESHADWVRPGIMLYGVSPFPDRIGLDFGLKPIMTLRSRVVSVKQLETGDRVGYGGQWVCRHPIVSGIVAIGYGDGYPRHAASGTPVLIRGKRAPLIGRVSMDMIHVDLEHCPDAEIGDSVVLWGKELPIEEVARHSSTIPYTLLCGVTQRVDMIEKL